MMHGLTQVRTDVDADSVLIASTNILHPKHAQQNAPAKDHGRNKDRGMREMSSKRAMSALDARVERYGPR